MSVAVIIPAAGRSSRFGGLDKKPFISLAGRPIWQRSAELFWTRSDVAKVYIVIAPDDRDMFRSRFGHLLAFVNAELVDGGAERFESVANALAKIPDDVELVAVHDAVRPLAKPTQIDAVFAAAKQHGAAMLATPLADTLKRVDPASLTVLETVPRSGLWQAQTPQVIRRDWLIAAYAQRAKLSTAITDDAQLVEACGHAVTVVESTPVNFKITTKADWELAELIVKAKNAPVSEDEAPARPAFGDEAQW
jgi:2-C-methyl-D-erythritol 4-phosphate cytidylyltransferase